MEVTCGAEGTLPLSFGNFYEALDIVTPIELGEVYNALEEAIGLGQGSTNFRHSERSEESQLTSL